MAHGRRLHAAHALSLVRNSRFFSPSSDPTQVQLRNRDDNGRCAGRTGGARAGDRVGSRVAPGRTAPPRWDWRQLGAVLDELPEWHTVTIGRGRQAGPMVITSAPKIG